MIVPNDDSSHPMTDDPFWNESCWFNFNIPERKIDGMVYYWFRPNMGYACGGPILFDSNGENPHDCLYWDYNWLQAVRPGVDVTHCRLPNGTSIERIEPLRRYRLRYEGKDCELDLLWESVMEPHELVLKDEVAEAGSRHYDQAGRVTGTVRLRGETLAVDCHSLRDRSWGPRHWAGNYGSDFLWCTVSPSSAFHAVTVEDGDDDRLIGGYLIRDGKLADLVSGRRRTIERNGPRPLRVAIDFTDALGRRLEAEGRASSWLAFQCYPELLCWQTLMSWEFDGRQGWGEVQETLFLESQRRAIRSGRYRLKP